MLIVMELSKTIFKDLLRQENKLITEIYVDL